MPTTMVIACEDCGHPVETVRTNTKVCAVCRLVRDLPYVAKSTRKYECVLCDKEYAPIDIRDPLCGSCAPEAQKYGITKCAFCGHERKRFRAEIDVCKECARNQKHRKRFWSSLRTKQRERKAVQS